MRTEMLGLVDGLSAYHLLRGATVEKVTKALTLTLTLTPTPTLSLT